MLKFDTHVHTSETSSCGNVSGRVTAQLYKKAGYDGICITDHYYKEYFEYIVKKSWEEKIEIFLAGYKSALSEGKLINLNVLLGMEIRFNCSNNDYLVFGITEKFLLENEKLYSLKMTDFSKLAKENNLLIYQAHPFRNGMIPENPNLIDGVEVYNANIRHDSRNKLAYKYAIDNNLKMLSGSDCHEIEDVGRGGIIIKKSIKKERELVEALVLNLVELIK